MLVKLSKPQRKLQPRAIYIRLFPGSRRLTSRIYLISIYRWHMYRYDILLLKIKEHLGQKPAARLKEIASSLGISRQTLHRSLRITGLRFRDIRDQVVMQKAEDLVASSPHSKKEIAYLLGFSSPGAFCQHMRRRAHKSHPSSGPRREAASS